MLPSGEKSLTGVSIVIQEVSRHHTGKVEQRYLKKIVKPHSVFLTLTKQLTNKKRCHLQKMLNRISDKKITAALHSFVGRNDQ